MILAGDFNFTDGTANSAALGDAGLRDAHDLAGSGRGSTWRFRALGFTHRLPGFRIDHIYVSDQMTCTSAQVLDTAGTDHRPIIADVAWASQRVSAERRWAMTRIVWRRSAKMFAMMRCEKAGKSCVPPTEPNRRPTGVSTR